MALFKKFFRRKSGRKSNRTSEIPEGIAYAYWSCLCDDESCEECKSLEGTAWIPYLVSVTEPPLSSCKSLEGCRCIVVYIGKEERGANDISEFIRKSGGKVTSEQLEQYEEGKMD
ncbi:MAG: hypothetical protein COT45_02940 [bacterium (Candidatus Stahlbacteria) CG08_land_8_20_14_0_20_40_26]|nr:MAG: hypothetical protein COX49_03945 [bacterium (Candidatus Stahlbacteria) CG23_combo_of_CG06-09_8_20_14_all_40_9]PIS25186.1 MAG: hypothetical protein COT45_02940 [bacterium (Candidatus Stahlbacteria) CG08_land_8_20_14_0_20_40_26]